jgi:putative hydrolase of HD superfamily
LETSRRLIPFPRVRLRSRVYKSLTPLTTEVKHKRELDTIEYLRDLLKPFNERAANEIYELWNEYENVSTPEARFVKDVDKFELMVQAFDFELRDKCSTDLSRLMSVRAQIKTKEVSEWADHVIEERLRLWEKSNKGVPKYIRHHNGIAE